MNSYKHILLKLLPLCCISLLVISHGCSPSSRRSSERANTPSVPTPLNAENGRHRTETPNRPTSPLISLYNKYRKSVSLVYTSDGDKSYQGSGFFVAKSGVAVSNYHVFEGTSKGLEVIKTIDGEQFKVEQVLRKSKKNDYIIFKVDIGNYTIASPIPVVSYPPQIGEEVFAIGNPKGLESTLSKGIVSALRDNNTLIQTTTEITHGSSGGPLLNMRGEVIGITTSGLGEANLNFAVNMLKLNLSSYY